MTRAELEELFRRHWAWAVEFATRFVAEEAEDFVQEVFIRSATKFQAERGRAETVDGRFRDFLGTCIVNLIRSDWRRPRPELVDCGEKGMDSVGHPIDAGVRARKRWVQIKVEEILDVVAPAEKSRLLMHFDGRTWREIGEANGITAESARTTTHRKLEQLKTFAASGSPLGIKLLALWEELHDIIASSESEFVLERSHELVE